MFRQRLSEAIEGVMRDRGWDLKRLGQEIGRTQRSIQTWLTDDVESPPFHPIARLSYLSRGRYPLGWFSGELSDEDLARQRAFAGQAAEIAGLINEALAAHEQRVKAETAALAEQLERSMEETRGLIRQWMADREKETEPLEPGTEAPGG